MHIQTHRIGLVSGATQISHVSRFTDRKLIGAIAALTMVSFGIAAALHHHPVDWLPLTWLGVFAVGWAPISFWMLRSAVRSAYTRATDDNSHQAQHQIEIFRATRRDALTGLPTRAVFSELLAGLVGGEKPAALLVIDLDNFSKINGQHGDGTGDDLLRAFADRLRTIAGGRDRVGRLDGDEFALLIDKPEDLRNLDETTAFVQSRLTEPYPTAAFCSMCPSASVWRWRRNMGSPPRRCCAAHDRRCSTPRRLAVRRGVCAARTNPTSCASACSAAKS